MFTRLSQVVHVARRSSTLNLQKKNSSIMVTAKKYVLVKHFEGEPKALDLKIVEEELPAIKNDGMISLIKYQTIC